MPIVDPEPLQRLIGAALQAVGAGAEQAATVARHMVGANLAGHDSHGVQLLPTYIDRVQRGDIVPGAPYEVLDETPTTARVDGHWGFGQVVSERAMALAIAKAQGARVAAITVVRQAHVGRVADYPLLAARAGLIGIMCCNSGRTAKQVVPFGGREPRLGTNPLCIALPSDLEAPIFIDMATSAAAGQQDRRLPQPRPAAPARLDRRPRRQSVHRPGRLRRRRGAPARRRRPGPQGLRSGLHDRGVHRRPHRPGLRGRPFRAPQRRRVAAGARPRRLPPRRDLPRRGRRASPVTSRRRRRRPASRRSSTPGSWSGAPSRCAATASRSTRPPGRPS